MHSATPLLNAATRAYGRLLRLLPAPLRVARRAEMVELFRDMYRDGYSRSGARGALAVALWCFARLARMAVTERLQRPLRVPQRFDGDRMFTRTLADLRLAIRTLRRSPGFTAISILTLALGIGATTAIFSLVYGVVIQGLPYDEAHNLVYVDHKAPAVGFDDGLGGAPGLYWHYSHHADLIEDVTYWVPTEVTITGAGTEPTRVPGARVLAEMFTILRTRPLHGRLFSADEDAAEGPRAVLLSHGFWQQRFAGDPGAVGQDLEVSGRQYPIVGILPPGFRFTGADVYLDNQRDFTEGFGGFNGGMIARVNTGTTVEALRIELDRQIGQIDRTFDDGQTAAFLKDSGIASVPIALKDFIIGPVQQTLWILMGTVGFVLLIACANVANLFLVRAEGRQREVAVRRALGASRAQVLRGSLTESLTLASAGCLAGLLIARVSMRVLLSRIPFDLPRADEIGLNAVVLVFAVAVSLVAGLVFGTLPVLRSGGDLTGALRDGSRSATAGKARVRTRQGLVVAQIALSLVLLSGAGLMARSFTKLANVDLGFVPENLLTFQLSLPSSLYEDHDSVIAFHDALRERLQALPGVESVGAVRDMPLGGRSGGDILLEENDPPAAGEMPPVIWLTRAMPGYFGTVGVPLLAGRTMTQADQDDASPVIVLNQTAAEVFFPGEDPLGQRVSVGLDGEPKWLEVIGIVGTTKQERLAETAEPKAFVPLSSTGTFNSARRLSFVMRVASDPLAMADAVRTVVRQADSNLPIIAMRSMDQIVSEAGAPMAFTMILLGIAAGIAMVLGSIGVYGVISYIVGHRTGEIGIRMAVGAAGPDVRRMLLGQGSVVALTGLGIGLAGTLALMSTMESLLYEVDPFDPLTHATTSLVLLGVVLLATWVPALRASRIDPVEALRSD